MSPPSFVSSISLLQFTCVGVYQNYITKYSFVSPCHSSTLKSSTCAPHDAHLSWDSFQTLCMISCVITVLRRKNVRVIFLLFSPLSLCKYNVHCTNKLSREPPTSVLTINIIKWLARSRRISFHTHDFSCPLSRHTTLCQRSNARNSGICVMQKILVSVTIKISIFIWCS